MLEKENPIRKGSSIDIKLELLAEKIKIAAIGSTIPDKTPIRSAYFFPFTETSGSETTRPSGIFCKDILRIRESDFMMEVSTRDIPISIPSGML